MFGIGWTELIVIALIVLVFVGPKHLPGMLRKLGRLTAELQAASRELRNQITIEVDDLESPSQLARGMGQAVIDNVTREYDDVRQADAELRRELEQLADPYAPAEEPAPGDAAPEQAPELPAPADPAKGEP